MNSVPFSFLPSVGDLTPLIVNVSRILVANMGDTDGKDEKHEALPSGSAFRDDASESFCYAAEDDEETQIHLGPKISIKEHLEKDKVSLLLTQARRPFDSNRRMMLRPIQENG
ncbi:unnamed protein product [Lactuca virosa]|uniref:Uncharacterized protein n=1 Tax=Lactuca virosa TaxID=75947 RepID=A0AAU9MHC5_9ASTR|nr:unnamed protein product [Lactuca virosa]